jgi:hypothetical protein
MREIAENEIANDKKGIAFGEGIIKEDSEGEKRDYEDDEMEDVAQPARPVRSTHLGKLELTSES